MNIFKYKIESIKIYINRFKRIISYFAGILLLELILKFRILLNFIISIILGNNINFIDTNSINDYLFSLINKISTLDTESQVVIYAIIILIGSLVYLTYIFIFMVSPSIFDAIKDILPIKIKTTIVKYIKFNRVISVPFVILSFIMVILLLLIVIFSLTVLVYFK